MGKEEPPHDARPRPGRDCRAAMKAPLPNAPRRKRPVIDCTPPVRTGFFIAANFK
jgi:hypothetical protein